MQDLSYEAFQQGKFKAGKTKLDLSYSTFLANKEKAQVLEQERQQLREQGLPVGTSTRKAGPTTAGGFVRSVAKPVIDVGTNLINAWQIALSKKETKPFSGDYFGKVEGLGKVDITKSPFEQENLKTIKRSVGTGLELGSYLGYGGAGTSAVKAGVSKLTETAAKQTFKEYFASQFPNLIKEGALTGAAYTGGTQMKESVETGEPFSWKQALTDVGTSTILTPVAALGLRRLFGTSAEKIIKAREVKEIANKLPSEVKPEIGLLKRDRALKELQENKKDVLQETITSEVSPKKEISNTEVPPTTKQESNFTKEEFENAYNTATRDFEPSEWNATTLQEQLSRFKELQQTDPDKLLRLALNSAETDKLRNNWALSFLENEAQKTGNIELSRQLSYSNVGSKAGGELVGSQFKDKNTLASIMRDIRKSRAKTQGFSEKSMEKEEQTLFAKLKENIASMKDKIPTKEEIDNIINDLRCR